ncbi:ABC transporter ATP-binding protein [Corynebacterium pacaense]|uniref:ABC transporter ATP-binding protein n=1 Tax=Corynebacterium pacaense TaxID=1816684 RepID=UPI0009BA169A|nr:sn-glycerol-3-phosphate ABC transporter ATP-binding protein UgpC [Corynebacterium pacaense]
MASISFDSVQCYYPGSDRPAVSNLSLDIRDGEFLVLVGPSGCGKSTTLRMLAGLEEVSEGTISIAGRDVTGVSPKDRDIAMVFQNYALYPHMTVAENMEFGLKIAGVSKKERRQKAEQAASLLGLHELLDRKPKELSGGQRQRVAMGRAVVREPKAFLMDEPLSNLDARLRVQMRTEVSRLTKQLGITTVYVTHDQTEAMTMGDRVAVLKDGELQQVATPSELYDNPANTFVAGFIGSPSMSLFDAPVYGDGLSIGRSTVTLPRGLQDSTERGRLLVGIRPEDMQLSTSRENTCVELTVTAVEVLGSEAYIYGTTRISPNADPSNLTVRTDGRRHPQVGDVVGVSINEEHLHLFDPATGNRLNNSVEFAMN